MAETWLKCTECKTDIPYGGQHFVCSVSTCKRSKFRLVFCTPTCWDSHLSSVRHREAWAEDAVAPTREAWQRELAQQSADAEQRRTEPPPHGVKPPASATPVVRRVVGEASPQVAAQLEGLTLSEVTDKDVLIVVSKMKKYIKDRSGFNCSDAVAEYLSEHVRAICDDAIRMAARDERRTVLDRDVPRARR
jgi:histone H3/H4